LEEAKKNIQYLFAAIKYLFEKSNFKTQKELALTAGVKDSIVSEILNGQKPYGIKTHIKIANAFGIKYVDLFKIGKELSEKKTSQSQPNMIQEIQTSYQSQTPGLEAAIKDLTMIYNSGDPLLITAITNNLTEFRRAAEDRKKHADDQKIFNAIVKRMEKKINDMDKKIEKDSKKKQPENSGLSETIANAGGSNRPRK